MKRLASLGVGVVGAALILMSFGNYVANAAFPTDHAVIDNQTSYLFGGWNEYRDTNELVGYDRAGTRTGTNRYGTEVAIVGCKVTRVEVQRGSMRVPSGGFVLSGHGHARVWLTNNAQVGDTITQLPGSSCNAPAPTPTETVTLTSTPATGLDVHGIKMLRPTIADGIVWTSNWTTARTFTSGSFDPQDPWMRGTGSGTYKAGGGEMKISGSTPRLYLRDPHNVRQWRDVEITTYFKRVADDNTAYAGMVAVARTNHLPDANSCDTRGYGARMRNDGKLDFAKETKHPTWVTASTKTQWSTGGLPKNQWLGYKFLVYDLPTGNVKVELYLDTTDGLNGGTWQLINSYEDTGSTWGVGSQGCAAGIDPTLRLTKASSRPGSETGRPNASIYFRSTNVSTDGLIYKKASVREIDVN